MTSRSGLRVLAAVLPLALLVPAAAHAEKVVLDDAVGDVVSVTDDQELGESVPAPDYAGVDVLRTTVAFGANRLRVGVRFRALERDPFQITVVRVKTPDRAFDISVERLGGKPIATIGRGPEDVECRGLAAKVDLGADTVTVSLPASCLDDPRWVQVGVGAVAIDGRRRTARRGCRLRRRRDPGRRDPRPDRPGSEGPSRLTAARSPARQQHDHLVVGGVREHVEHPRLDRPQ